MPSLPVFAQMLTNYPAGSPDAVKRAIGGKVDAAWITNTCTIRMSRVFNYSGAPVPNDFAQMNVVSGADRKWYAYRVREMKRWLRYRFGRPNLETTSAVDRTSFSGQKGVIAFDIHFPDATGHLDLWDGSTYVHEAVDPRDYFTLATKVDLWLAP